MSKNEINQFVLPETEFNLLDLFNIIFKHKFLLLIFIISSGSLAIYYSLSLPNIYTSSALLSSSDKQDGIGNALKSYSSIASLAGISIPNGSANSATEAIETMQSFSFFANNFLPNIKLQDLMAYDSWNGTNNLDVYNKQVFDDQTNEWKLMPTQQQSYLVFKNHLRIKENPSTGFITLSIEHKSPKIAKSWLEIIINSINNKFREDQKNRSVMSIEYLNEKIISTNITEIKLGLSALIQQETQKLMLVEANKDFVFKIIDPPYSPENRSSPQRGKIAFFITIIGTLLGIVFILTKHFYPMQKSYEQ